MLEYSSATCLPASSPLYINVSGNIPFKHAERHIMPSLYFFKISVSTLGL